MNDRIKKWIWKLSGADKEIRDAQERFIFSEEKAKRLEEELKRAHEPVEPECMTGDWCQNCKERYETVWPVYLANGGVTTETRCGCKLNIFCKKFKEDAKE